MHTIVAVLLQLCNKANSPNDEPSLISATANSTFSPETHVKEILVLIFHVNISGGRDKFVLKTKKKNDQ